MVYMDMHTINFKQQGEIVHNPSGKLSSVTSLPWWNGFGSLGQVKSSSIEHPSRGDQHQQADRRTDQGLERGNATQFTISSGDCRSPEDGKKSKQLNSVPDYQNCFEIGFNQPVIPSKYPYMDQYYGVYSAYGPQLAGRIMLPLNLTTDEGPIYVNAKQYHGIIRRRQSRAKLELQNKVINVRKPYLHESRHLHAMRRARGCGGRFLNTKNSNGGKDMTDGKKAGGGQLSRPTGSQISEVLQSDGGNLNSSKEAKGSKSHPSGSEVTSMFSTGDANHFQMNHLHPSVHNMMDGGRGIVVPHKWVAASESCCNLKM